MIYSQPEPNVLAHGPSITNYTVNFYHYSSAGPNVTWYKNDTPLTEGFIIQSLTNITSSTTLQIARRSDKGQYRVVVKNGFGDQYVVPNDILSLYDDYTFDISVLGKLLYATDST